MMWFLGFEPNQVLQVVVLLSWVTRCNGSKHNVRSAVSYFNTTSTSTTKTSSESTSVVLSTATVIPVSLSSSVSTRSTSIISNGLSSSASTTSSSTNSLITAKPTFPTYMSEWGNQSIPIDTCTELDSTGSAFWTHCNIVAPSVTVSYFPEPSGNITYPSVIYNPAISMTMTSPSIYLVVETIWADNRPCLQLGPTFSNQVIVMNPTDVYTLQPYADEIVMTRMGPPKLLTLSDLNDCSTNSYDSIQKEHHSFLTHPVDGKVNRCFPRISWPSQINSLGGNYWKDCDMRDADLGLFDPPVAVPPVTGLIITKPQPITSTLEPAAPIVTLPVQAPNTNTAVAAATSTAIPPLESVPAPASSNIVIPPVSVPVSTNNPGEAPVTQLSQASVTQNIPTTTSPPVIAVIGTNTISAAPDSSNIILPNGSTASVGVVLTLTDSNSVPVVVSVGSSGLVVTGAGVSSTYYPNPAMAATTPAVAPVPVATVGGQVISAVPGASTVIIGGQTVTSGGAAITIPGSNAVATFGSSGLIVQQPGGAVATYAIPSASAVVIGTINGIAITAIPGASTVVYGTQTMTIGGAPITLPNHEVLSLGPSGIIEQIPGGGVKTIALPGTLTSGIGLWELRHRSRQARVRLSCLVNQ
ncbi:hypothetical protein BGZ60DRAFT_136768 [Tricladium varicosporioides]|nr:hypothetical protein BGZ60DRAFT_136768 [Hymenoscyphus varicosporioides]